MSRRAACLALAFAWGAARGAPPPSAEDLLRAADAARHPLREGTIRIRATLAEPGKPETRSEVDVHVRGTDRALCVFREGPQAGRKVLSVAGRAWLLVPTSARAVSIGAAQRLIGGASIADVARLRFATDFTGTLRGEESVDGVPCRVVELRAKDKSVPYASGTLWIGRSDSLARRARLNLRSGKEAKEVLFTDYGEERGAIVLRRMEIRHRLAPEQGMRTVLEFLRYEPHAVPDAYFDPLTARAVP